MLTLVLGSLPAPLTYCCVHQRAWVTSLNQWVAFHVPTRDGSPVTDAPCDCCLAGHEHARAVRGHRGWRAARGE
jgi:hypothetical protein